MVTFVGQWLAYVRWVSGERETILCKAPERLRAAIEAYIAGGEMTTFQIAAMRVYLRQWIASPLWPGSEIEALRRDVDGLQTRAAIDAWLDRAEAMNIDPL